MNNTFRTIAIILAIFVFIIAMPFGILWYKTRIEVTVVDSTQSSDGDYELTLQAVGEPYFPFGSAPGRLVLKKGETIVAKVKFQISNDGGSFDADSWNVTWYGNRVEVILSGAEQYDELVVLYFNGKTEDSSLTTRYGVEKSKVSNNNDENVETESDADVEQFPDEWEITAGYQAIYELYSDNSPDDFEVYYGATERSTRCVLFENENTVEYLVYDGKSENEKCGLYVHYQSNKNGDGVWAYDSSSILDIYAYVFESGDVISSGKTSWEDEGSEEYQKATAEK
jgi:hypothetical protein